MTDPTATSATVTMTNTGIPNTSARAASVKPSGRAATGTWWLPAMK